MDFDTLIINLAVIAQLQASDKLCVRKLPGETQLSIHSGKLWLQSVTRYWQQANRRDMVEFLNTLVNFVEKFTDLLKENEIHRQQLQTHIQAALTGIASLKTTYNSDSNVIAFLSLQSKKMSDCLHKLQEPHL